MSFRAEGASDARNGLPYGANPYDPGDAYAHEEWIRGWSQEQPRIAYRKSQVPELGAGVSGLWYQLHGGEADGWTSIYDAGNTLVMTLPGHLEPDDARGAMGGLVTWLGRRPAGAAIAGARACTAILDVNGALVMALPGIDPAVAQHALGGLADWLATRDG